MEGEYFEQLIKVQFDHLNKEIKELKDDTQKILLQTTKTNGRVIDLEKWQATIVGRDMANEKNENKTNWWIVFFVSLVSIAATVLATREWH